MDLTGDPLPEDRPEYWTIAPADTIAWREWDGELVVYLDEVGSTHLLNPYAGAIFLTLLQNGAGLGLDQILDRLNDDDLAINDALRAPGDALPVRRVMAEFERIGLVRRH